MQQVQSGCGAAPGAAGARPLSVPLRLLAAGPLEWSTTVSASALLDADSPGPLGIADAEVPLQSKIAVAVALERINGGLRAVGEVTATWTGPCARCWLPLEGHLRAEVSEVLAADPRDGDQYALGPEYADLVPMVREAVLLSLPIEAIRCPNPDPCPNLPEELAEKPEAETRPADPRWAALDALCIRPGSADG